MASARAIFSLKLGNAVTC